MPTDRESAEQSAAHEVLTMTLAEAAEAITSLEAENKRLREALGEISHQAKRCSSDAQAERAKGEARAWAAIAAIADNALSTKGAS